MTSSCPCSPPSADTGLQRSVKSVSGLFFSHFCTSELRSVHLALLLCFLVERCTGLALGSSLGQCRLPVKTLARKRDL